MWQEPNLPLLTGIWRQALARRQHHEHYQRQGEPALIVVMHNCLSGRWRAAR
jgi:hypothetical protein